VNAEGILIEKATGSYPRFGYGLPFAEIDVTDPQAPYKIMYNFFRTLVQWDDINVLVNFFWTTPDVLDRYVDFRGQALSYGSRWSGPIANPDEVAAKVLIYGTAPYDVVGLATLDWNYLDPERWRSLVRASRLARVHHACGERPVPRRVPSRSDHSRHARLHARE